MDQATKKESSHGSGNKIESSHGSGNKIESSHGSVIKIESSHGSVNKKESSHGSGNKIVISWIGQQNRVISCDKIYTVGFICDLIKMILMKLLHSILQN
ncbi:hypothetical protein Bpfe_001387 [Biomphalaria pfeifferi]|uniref:Uncharacterized protein n=1 Tax=Biomphalaria pfeifferi TaxID=112525 RepID=A0AAD8CA55_BIOPF|nr:hypothetical protein Bpfe_001387 [Biomphalaria pfeifferi]